MHRTPKTRPTKQKTVWHETEHHRCIRSYLLVYYRQLQAGYFKVILQAPYFRKRLIKYLRKYLNVIVVLDVLKRENESSFPATGSYSIMSLFPCGRVLQKFSDVCEVHTTLGITVGNDRGVECRKYFWEWWGELVFSTGFPDRRWAVHTVETLTSESKCRYVRILTRQELFM